jgi:hypothetical protein
MKLTAGTLVSKRHPNNPRPQAIRHGIVKEIKGLYALVQFHGGTQPKQVRVSELQKTQP